MNKLLEKRNIAKSKKPKFKRHDSNKYKFKNKWRKPRGLHNKRRLNKKGHQKNPSTGYGSPKLVKYLSREGKNKVSINTFSDLDKINKEKDIAVLSSKLGLKKKLQILEKALSLNIIIDNVKDIKKYIKEKKNMLEEKKIMKKKRLSEKEKSKKEALKKAEEKKKGEGKEDKQKEIKEEVLGAKQEIKKVKEIIPKKDTSQSKKGHAASGVPGTKQ